MTRTPSSASSGPRAEDELVVALEECRRAARAGYELASSHLESSSKALEAAGQAIQGSLFSFRTANVQSSGVVPELEGQLEQIAGELRKIREEASGRLRRRAKHLEEFRVTLFGRTMAGKSTLMEILTRGNGTSIGLGEQRKTRDVRTYSWKGLLITDVPGVAAFEGYIDADVALRSAEEADLIAFLITDDAPQPVEAEHLVRVKRLGKPLIGICNVKLAVDRDSDRRRFLRAPDQPFDPKRLNELMEQFLAFVRQHAPDGRVTFIPAHLRSRFLASQPQHATDRQALLRASRFETVERRIIDEIRHRGAFFRFRAFVDGAVAPMLGLMAQLLEFAAKHSQNGRLFLGKRASFARWARRFDGRSRAQITAGVSEAFNTLSNLVPEFAEDHYDAEDVAKQWQRLVRSHRIEDQLQAVQEGIRDDCLAKVRDVARELKTELSVLESLASSKLGHTSVVDGKRIWNWGVTILSGGLGIAALALMSGPLGWVAAGVGLVGGLLSWLFDDREDKVRRARQKLEKKIADQLEKQRSQTLDAILRWYGEQIDARLVRGLERDLQIVTSALFSLADSQRKLAWALNEQCKDLNRRLVVEGIARLDGGEVASRITRVARVPGIATLLLIPRDFEMPKQLRNRLESLLGEQLLFAVDTGAAESIIAQAIGRGCTRKDVHLEPKIGVAHVSSTGDVSPDRLRIAAQISGYHVVVDDPHSDPHRNPA